MKICTNCAYGNVNWISKCSNCNADLTNAVPFKWNDFATRRALVKEIKANKDVFGRVAPAKRLTKKDRKKQLDVEGVAYCPKCLSTSLSAHKKGFGIGKAVIGAAFAPIGLVAGNIGAKKVRVTCLKCGHQFWAGK
jgi:hypothetical protein